MPLVIVNPSTTKPRRKRSATAPQAKKGVPMAKRRRSAAQKRAFAKMISRNPNRRRRRVVHTNPVRHVTRRRTVRRNPAPYRHRRRHRNPSGDGFLGQLFNKQGLMLLGAVVAGPTIMAEGQKMIFPNATGYYQAGIQGTIGVGLGYLAFKFLDKQVGTVVAAMGVGTAIAELITGYNAGTLSNSVLSGLPQRPVVGGFPVRNTLGSREAGARTLRGYTGAGVGGRACSVMSGYVTQGLQNIPEPGARRIR